MNDQFEPARRDAATSTSDAPRVNQERFAFVFYVFDAIFSFRFFTTYKRKMFFSVLVAIIAWYYFQEDFCDASISINRDFNRYYGIKRNLFGALSAEQQANVEPFFQPIFTESMKAPSIIILAGYGAGKTHIRSYRLSKLHPDEHLVVKLYGNDPDFNSFLVSYAENVKDLGEENADQDLLFASYFNSKDFLNIMISQLVDKTLDEYENLGIDNVLAKMDKKERARIECLLIFYSKKSYKKEELTSEITTIQNFYGNVRIFDQKKIEINTHNLAVLAQKLNISPADFLDKTGNPNDVLKTLAEFLRTRLNKRLVFVVDSLDESEFFFGGDAKTNKINSTKATALQKFVDAIATTEVLALALGEAKTKIFDILIFFPKINEINVNNWERRDKIPVVSLDWTSQRLSNYADFMLTEMSKQNNSRCKSVPTSLKDLLDGTENEKLALDALRQPRDLHRFMSHLIQSMEDSAKDRLHRPFIATQKDIYDALKKLENEGKITKK